MNDISTSIKYLEMRTVLAVFASGQGSSATRYSYFVPEGDEPKVGDVILTSVHWETDTDHENEVDEKMTTKELAKIAVEGRLARIVEVHNHPHEKANKFYMQLIPMADLRSRYITNREMAGKIAERKRILAKLDTLLLQQSKIEHYKRLAENNPEAASLLKELSN